MTTLDLIARLIDALNRNNPDAMALALIALDTRMSVDEIADLYGSLTEAVQIPPLTVARTPKLVQAA